MLLVSICGVKWQDFPPPHLSLPRHSFFPLGVSQRIYMVPTSRKQSGVIILLNISLTELKSHLIFSWYFVWHWLCCVFGDCIGKCIIWHHGKQKNSSLHFLKLHKQGMIWMRCYFEIDSKADYVITINGFVLCIISIRTNHGLHLKISFLANHNMRFLIRTTGNSFFHFYSPPFFLFLFIYHLFFSPNEA